MGPHKNTLLAEHRILVKADSIASSPPSSTWSLLVSSRPWSASNGFVRAGVDGDHGRGNSADDRYDGDPTVHPTPCLGPLEKGPFTAFKVVIGDLGTKGGMVTDVDGQVLSEDGSVIDGLYSAGNNAASVMGRTCPGPGSTIGPAVVFGLRAARHMARHGE